MGVILVLIVLALLISGGIIYTRVQSPASKPNYTSVEKSSPLSTISSSSQFVKEYDLPNGLPNAICVDSSGNIWTVLQNSSSLGVFNPANGTVHEYPIPGLRAKFPLTSWGITIDNSREIVWFAEEISNAIWSFDVQNQTFKEYSILTPESNPYQVAVDSSGNVWFTEFSGDKIGVVTTNGSMHEFQIPISSSNPTGIAVDQRSNRVWFNLLDTSGLTDEFYVGSFYNGSFTFNDITPLVDTPVGIAIDSSGNLWLTQHGASLVSEFNPITHYFRTISTSIPPVGASYPYFVYVDNITGRIWFNEHYGNAISVFDPKTGSLIEYEIPSRNPGDGNISGALTMTLSPSGTPWFTEPLYWESRRNKLLRSHWRFDKRFVRGSQFGKRIYIKRSTFYPSSQQSNDLSKCFDRKLYGRFPIQFHELFWTGKLLHQYGNPKCWISTRNLFRNNKRRVKEHHSFTNNRVELYQLDFVTKLDHVDRNLFGLFG